MEAVKDFVSQPKTKSVMISPMPRTMSVQKSSSIKRVAHEPIKGAVHPVTSVQSTVRPMTPVTVVTRENVTKYSPPAVNTVKPTQSPRQVTTPLQRITDDNRPEVSFVTINDLFFLDCASCTIKYICASTYLYLSTSFYRCSAIFLF